MRVVYEYLQLDYKYFNKDKKSTKYINPEIDENNGDMYSHFISNMIFI